MANELVLTCDGALVHEHRGIERVVRAIATMGDDVEGCRFVEPSILVDVASFLRAFALECQKAKEETMLYPLLEAKLCRDPRVPPRESRGGAQQGRSSPGIC